MGARLHQEEDHLAGDVAADAVHVHVAPTRHPAKPPAMSASSRYYHACSCCSTLNYAIRMPAPSILIGTLEGGDEVWL